MHVPPLYKFSFTSCPGVVLTLKRVAEDGQVLSNSTEAGSRPSTVLLTATIKAQSKGCLFMVYS